MCGRSLTVGLPQTRLPPASPYPCRKEEKQMNKLTQKIDADGKLEPDRVDAILNAWKAYAGGNDHVVQ